MPSAGRLGRSLRRTALQAAPTILGVVTLSFFLLRLAPGDAVDVMAGEAGSSNAQSMALLRAHYGLDQPIFHQFLAYLKNLCGFSLGYSPRFNMPVSQLIGERLPATLMLMGVALVIALALGVTVGVLMAAYQNRIPDRLLSLVSLLFYSVPGFWISLMLILLFSVKLGWLPSGGAETIGSDATGLAAVADRARYMVLPALSLSLAYAAVYARLTRVAMLDVKTQDFVRTAAAKGLAPHTILIRHVLRNALIPVTTVAGTHMGAMLGGAVVVETVFGWPGLGRLAYEAVMGRDFNVLLGILLLSSMLVIAANALVDLLHAVLDPRVGVR